jgi:hypothetical protein
VRIWEEGHGSNKPLHTIQSSALTQTITDAAWSPLYETVLGAVTGDGKVRRSVGRSVGQSGWDMGAHPCHPGFYTYNVGVEGVA